MSFARFQFREFSRFRLSRGELDVLSVGDESKTPEVGEDRGLGSTAACGINMACV